MKDKKLSDEDDLKSKITLDQWAEATVKSAMAFLSDLHLLLLAASEEEGGQENPSPDCP